MHKITERKRAEVARMFEVMSTHDALIYPEFKYEVELYRGMRSKEPIKTFAFANGDRNAGRFAEMLMMLLGERYRVEVWAVTPRGKERVLFLYF